MADSTLKLASPDDVSLISTLGHDIWRKVYPAIIGANQVEYMLQMMYNVNALKAQIEEQGHLFFILYWEGKEVGFVSCSLHSGSDFQRTRIHKLYLQPELHGQGLGAFMLQHIAGLSIAENDKALELNVNKYNPALQFYQKQGFDIEREVVIDIGNGFVMDDYVMVRYHTP